ncbi:molybdenum cofactor guanylyltransferase MobA [Hoeflea olei]|uniref:Molybdenum cofactor guanylyltransferase n=1 Tax=Hoeflea olei TaxID=1480615 RepID=A0A1C1YWJ3_9HYPH|nr:molybdenum cofactor guanylyltransferase MobA [Hoeflea olei]OCW57923.1 hypothetical protein AWJ14_03800 [Hoeflea olei]
MRIWGGILAGGRGLRMQGLDKPFADLAGQPLVAHVIARLAPQTAGLVINANTAPERFHGFGLDIVADSHAGYRGPLAGIETLLRAGRARNASHMLVAPADTPFLPHDLCARLSAAAQAPMAVRVACSSGRRHPVVALWPTALHDDLDRYLAATDDLSMAAYMRRLDLAEVDFSDPLGRDPFFNINDPADLAHAERLAATASDRAG